jgi:hypothetical protein
MLLCAVYIYHPCSADEYVSYVEAQDALEAMRIAIDRLAESDPKSSVSWVKPVRILD